MNKEKIKKELLELKRFSNIGKRKSKKKYVIRYNLSVIKTKSNND
jgi:hypothetical protein